ncbi:RNA-binding protein [Telluribacter sp.]|jgi:RNA recognition motif-containing protein|uniref:RNA recognition motif domain-containing protein n=1 Tax=Telluribacter sp. TaxID=1978767 RepID=UPI002E16181F|nr:RNA-binding protein [Telluribacter sp.]
MDIFVGSLPFKIKERELQEIFEKYGEVLSVKIIIDHETRQNKGFGFVKMPDENQARHAIAELNGVEIEGRALVVNESKFKKEPGRTGDSRPERSTPRSSSDSTPRPTDRSSSSDRPDRSSSTDRPASGGGGYQGGGFNKGNDSGKGGGASRGGSGFSKGGYGKGDSGKGGNFKKDGGFDRGRGGKGGSDRPKGNKGGNRWDYDDE